MDYLVVSQVDHSYMLWYGHDTLTFDLQSWCPRAQLADGASLVEPDCPLVAAI